MGTIRLVLGYLVIQGSMLESRIGREVRSHMEWSLVHVFPPNTLTEFGQGDPLLWKLLHMSCTFACTCVGITFQTNYYLWFIWNVYLFSQGPSPYPWTLLNLHDHFKWSCAMVLGVTLGCLVHIVCNIKSKNQLRVFIAGTFLKQAH